MRYRKASFWNVFHCVGAENIYARIDKLLNERFLFQRGDVSIVAAFDASESDPVMIWGDSHGRVSLLSRMILQHRIKIDLDDEVAIHYQNIFFGWGGK